MKLSVCVFAGPGTVPLEAGRAAGLFAANGIELELVSTRSSVGQMSGLAQGRYHLVVTAFDNVLAYCARSADLVVVAGGHDTRLPLLAAPGTGTIAALRGRTVAVDAPDTGFAFLLRDMLANDGLSGEDVSFRSYGAPAERWAALQGGEVAAALLNEHLAAVATSAGYDLLHPEPDPWGNYESNVVAGQRAWAIGHVDLVLSFRKGVEAAIAYVMQPQHRDAVAGAASQHLGAEPDAARRIAASLAAGHGLNPDLSVSTAGMKRVAALRRRYGPAEALPDSAALMLPELPVTLRP